MPLFNPSDNRELETREVTEPERKRLYVVDEAANRTLETDDWGTIVSNRAIEQEIKSLDHSIEETVANPEVAAASQTVEVGNPTVTDLDEYRAAKEESQELMAEDARSWIERLAS